MAAKPIFIVITPGFVSVERMSKIQRLLTRRLKDYHVIVCSARVEDIQFQCFNPETIDPQTLEEIKSHINELTNGKAI